MSETSLGGESGAAGGAGAGGGGGGAEPIQRFVLDNGLLGPSDRNEQAVWRMCHMRISAFSVTQSKASAALAAAAEPETVRIAVSMRKSDRRTLRTPPFEAVGGRALDIQFSFRYAHTFKDAADVLVVRLQRATRKKRHNTVALAPIYLSDILQCPLDDDITLSQKTREKTWVPYAKIHVLMGSYPEHVTSLDDAQDWEFGLLPEGQNAYASDDDAAAAASASFEPSFAPSLPVPVPSLAAAAASVADTEDAAFSPVRRQLQQQQQQQHAIAPPSPVTVASSAPSSDHGAKSSKAAAAAAAKKKAVAKAAAKHSPKSRTRRALMIGHDDLVSSSSSDTDDELPPSYTETMASAQLDQAALAGSGSAPGSAGTSVASGVLSETAATTGANAISTSAGPQPSGTSSAALTAAAAAAAAAAQQAEAAMVGVPINFQDPDLQRTAETYERMIRGASRLLLCDGQKRRSRRMVEVGDRPRVRESGTCTVCTRSARDVAALLSVLFDRRDEPTSVVIAGSDRFVNDVMRPFLELSNTKPLDSEPVRFFVVPVGKSSDVAIHVSTLDAEYRALFCDETWTRAFDKREPLSPEEVSTLEQRLLRYLDGAAAVCRFDVGEVMATIAGGGSARAVPFIKAVHVVPTEADSADASIDYWTPPKKKADHDQHHQVKSPLQTLVVTRLPGIAAKVLRLESDLFPTADTLSTVILLSKTGIKSAMKAFAGRISEMMHDSKSKKDKEKEKERSSPAPASAATSSSSTAASTTDANGDVEVVDLTPRPARPSTPLAQGRSVGELPSRASSSAKGDKDKEKEKEKSERGDKDKDKEKEKVEQIAATVTRLMCSGDSHSSFRVMVDGIDFTSVKMVSIKPTWRATRPFFIRCFSLSRQQPQPSTSPSQQ